MSDNLSILQEIIKILETMTEKEFLELKETNKELYEKKMEEKYRNFSEENYSLFRMVIDGIDLDPLIKMIEVLEKINKGEKDREDGENEVGKYLGKFLPHNLV